MIARNTSPLRSAAVFVLCAALTMMVAGCGSDSKSDSSSSKSKSPAKAKSASEDTGTTDTDPNASAHGVSASALGAGTLAKADADVTKRNGQYSSAPTLKLDPKQTYKVQLKTSKGTIIIDVDQKAGPIAAANFVALVQAGFFDGVKFHRVIKDFMIQTGDPTGTGTGGPGYEIKDDPVKEDYAKGTVAMANAGPNTGGSQFFIVQGDGSQLSPDYAIFGHVEKGSLATVDAIASVPVTDNGQGEQSQPTSTVKIISAQLLPAAK